MKIVIQRVKRAKAVINVATHSEIGPGLVALVGIHKDDGEADVAKMAKKLLKIRLFDEWEHSVVSAEKELLCLSQFTLFARFKGQRPSFHLAHREAIDLWDYFLQCISQEYAVKSGVYAAMTQVELVNDGPVTVILDSNE